MIESDDDMCLTLDQKSIDILIRLRGRFVTPEDVLSIKPKIEYKEAIDIASVCNELLLEVQRYLLRRL